MGWLEALHPEDVEPIMKALRIGSPIDVEFRLKSIDRGWRWMRFQGSPKFGPSGQILRWYGSVEDVDARKQ
jgi:PAS domain-containing protein